MMLLGARGPSFSNAYMLQNQSQDKIVNPGKFVCLDSLLSKDNALF